MLWRLIATHASAERTRFCVVGSSLYCFNVTFLPNGQTRGSVWAIKVTALKMNAGERQGSNKEGCALQVIRMRVLTPTRGVSGDSVEFFIAFRCAWLEVTSLSLG